MWPGPSEDVRGMLASVEAVLGPVVIEELLPGGSRWYRVRGRRAGREVRVIVRTDRGVLAGVVLTHSLGGRPITMMAHDRRSTVIVGVPEVRTGDAEVDREFVINGLPVEVLTDALDARCRRWLLDAFRGEDPRIETEDGFLTCTVRVRVMKGLVALPRGRVMPPEELASWIDAVTGLGDRLTGAFDRRRDEIARADGAVAAERWSRRHAAAMQARDRRRWALRAVLLAAFVGVPLLAALAIVAFVLFQLVR